VILFKPEHVAPILLGRKIETRRDWKTWRARVGSIHKAKTEMMSRNYFALIEILDRWEERLGDISEESVHNEGYDSCEAYEAKFLEIYGFWDPDRTVKVIKFRRVA
jgi:hypothetical protein